MSFDQKRKQFDREPIYIVEIEQDYCSLTYGVAPCTAQVGVTGSDKCYNTEASCQDLPSYNNAPKVYRFCQMLSPHPKGLDAIPALKSVSISPSQIKIDGGLSINASVSLTLDDFPSTDIDIDKYVAERNYIALERGTYWTKWRARNPNYQGRPLRVLSGYLNDDGSYDVANFQTRHYIIESIDASGDSCSIVAKDPLKLASRDRAQVPAPSRGKLTATLTGGSVNMVVNDTSEYTAGDYVRISDEVMLVDSVDSATQMTVTRAQYNTTAKDHGIDDTVQLCKLYSGQVNTIIESLLTDAGIDAAFIPSAEWQSEADDWLRGNYEAIITEPTDVNRLLKELGEQAPHSLYWDERTQTIKFTAVKPPPATATTYNERDHFIADSFSVKDERDMQLSTIMVYFGQIDPTEKIDETNNYRQVYARINSDAINRYGTNNIKRIYSRWISSTNEAQARVLAAKTGQRFGIVPRAISFSLDPKDAGLWAGQTMKAQHRYITDFSGAPESTFFQVLSVRESNNYRYQAIEYTFDEALPEDEGGGEPGVDLLIISGEETNLSIRDLYDTQIAVPPDASTKVKLIVESNGVIGSTSVAEPALVTGSWPAGATVTLENRGFIVGKGGDGASIPPTTVTASSGDLVGQDGGTALSLDYPITLNNLGVIGGGGGGGGGAVDNGNGIGAFAGGGGGAGYIAGSGGISWEDAGYSVQELDFGSDGTLEEAGAGGIVEWTDNGTFRLRGGGSGIITFGLGENGQSGSTSPNVTNGVVGAGGTAGNAITTNGNTITYTEAGDIRGNVV